MPQAKAEHTRTLSGSQRTSLSTEMRDTARLVDGRIVFDRRVIMARAWSKARYEAAGYAAIGHADLFPLLGLFAEALRNAWADAHAMAWKLRPAMPLTERAVIELAIADIEHADRPGAFELARLVITLCSRERRRFTQAAERGVRPPRPA